MVRKRRGEITAGEERIEHIPSTIESLDVLRQELSEYGARIPAGCAIRVASPDLRLNSVLPGNDRILYVKMFKYGLQLPLDPL